MSNCNHKLLELPEKKRKMLRRNVSVDNFTAPSSHFVIISPHVSESIKEGGGWAMNAIPRSTPDMCSGCYSQLFFILAFEFDKTSAASDECERIELCVAPYDVFEWMLLLLLAAPRRPTRRRKRKLLSSSGWWTTNTFRSRRATSSWMHSNFVCFFQFSSSKFFFISYFVKIKNSTFCT